MTKTALPSALGLMALLGVTYAGTLAWLADSWLANAYYSHAPLLALLALGLAWRRRASLAAGDGSPLGFVVLAVGLLANLGAAVWQERLVSAFSLPVVLAGVAMALRGTKALLGMAFPLVLVALAVPLPVWDRLSPPLQAAVASWAPAWARAIGVDAVSFGSQVQVAGSTLLIGAPCSGVNSMVTLLTLAVLVAWLMEGPLWLRALLLIAAAPVALLANLVRLTSLLWVTSAFGEGAGFRYYHDFSSPVVLLAGLGLLIALGWGLGCRQIRADI